jgi:hypothetical protein
MKYWSRLNWENRPLKRRVRKKHWSRMQRQARADVRRIKGQHDAIVRRLRMTPEQLIREFVDSEMTRRSFHDALFPNIVYKPE